MSTTKMDHFISATDAATLHTVLTELGLATVGEDSGLIPAEGVALDVLGTWCEQPEDPEAPPVVLPGYHANLRTEQPIDWPPSITVHQPETPWRVWA
ncbi:hypothetical protein ACIPK7_06245 [Pseudomonas sp. NPDC086581]|uniref:hypothetical protein n=1 Tax=Pseudomonas sp. NPDC086581 TaxID=3364432 RepID=UPI00381ABA0E